VLPKGVSEITHDGTAFFPCMVVDYKSGRK
jgi:hypothetical protein